MCYGHASAYSSSNTIYRSNAVASRLAVKSARLDNTTERRYLFSSSTVNVIAALGRRGLLVVLLSNSLWKSNVFLKSPFAWQGFSSAERSSVLGEAS